MERANLHLVILDTRPRHPTHDSDRLNSLFVVESGMLVFWGLIAFCSGVEVEEGRHFMEYCRLDDINAVGTEVRQ